VILLPQEEALVNAERSEAKRRQRAVARNEQERNTVIEELRQLDADTQTARERLLRCQGAADVAVAEAEKAQDAADEAERRRGLVRLARAPLGHAGVFVMWCALWDPVFSGSTVFLMLGATPAASPENG
jgi:hypothetical protein